MFNFSRLSRLPTKYTFDSSYKNKDIKLSINTKVEIGQKWYANNIKRWGIVESIVQRPETAQLRELGGTIIQMALENDLRVIYTQYWVHVTNECICEICNDYDCKQKHFTKYPDHG